MMSGQLPASAIKWIGPSALIALVVAFLHGFIIVDDAYITFRYAQHLLHGDGLVFNLGERVEGFTNLSWALISSLLLRLSFPVDVASVVLGVMFGLLAIYELWRCCAELGATTFQSGLAATSIGAHPSYWLMAGNGLEGGLVAFLLMRLCRCVISGRDVQASVIGGALFTTRPDTLLAIPLAVAWVGILRVSGSKSGTFRSRALNLLSVWALVAIAVTSWRLWYYGEWVPNTIHAKVPPPGIGTAQLMENVEDGLSYLVHFALALPVQAAAVIMVLLLGPTRALLWFVLGLPAILIPAILANGGDWMPEYRLLMPYAPVLSIPVALASPVSLQSLARARLIPRLPGLLLWMALFIPLALSLWRDPKWHGTPGFSTRLDTPCWIEVGRRLAKVATADDRFAVELLGFVSYYNSTLYMHDLLSLTDRIGARQGRYYVQAVGKFDPAHTLLDIQPNLIIFGDARFFLPALRAEATGAFNRNYKTSFVTLNSPDCNRQTGVQSFYMSFRLDTEDRMASAFADARWRSVGTGY
jgi:hypothetical protein